jgi:hypothetical protein
MRVSEMVDEHLLGKCEWPPETLTTHGHSLGPPGVDRFDERRRRRGGRMPRSEGFRTDDSVWVLRSDGHPCLPSHYLDIERVAANSLDVKI